MLISVGACVGRCFGSQPRAKVSMIDDDHAATAAGARTWQHARFVERCGLGSAGLFGAGRHGEQLACLRDVGGTVTTGKQPVMTDAVETPG